MRTARAERLHIGIFGNRNAGKSSLLNTLTGQEVAIVSDIKGTTTDPIYKAMEIPGLGPVVFIDTAGIDDFGDLGAMRAEKSKKVIDKCDAFIYLLSPEDDFYKELERKNKPIIYLVAKADLEEQKKLFEEYRTLSPLAFISGDDKSKKLLLNQLRKRLRKKEERTITQGLVNKGDVVLLVAPQDIQAPKGRLIMAQVQTIRELLDKKALVVISGVDNLGQMLETLKKSPDLVITDSQYFKEVSTIIPSETRLTSFSVLFSAYKGDLGYFIESVKILDEIEKVDKILIAEACSHPPLEEDIGRVKIPNLLKKKFNKDFDFTFASGDDFGDMESYDLIIHCGSCMFNRSHLINRVDQARAMSIPMTNYGIVIAYLQGILSDVVMPE